MHILLNVRCF